MVVNKKADEGYFKCPIQQLKQSFVHIFADWLVLAGLGPFPQMMYIPFFQRITFA